MNKLQTFFPIEKNGDIQDEVYSFLTSYQEEGVAKHSVNVAEEAKRICRMYEINEMQGYQAGLLHDCSVVIPNEERVLWAKEMDMVVFPEEEKLPMILHQRLSKRMACDCFGIQDKDVLNAIECHTTLKRNPTTLDMIVFVADKIQWDQEDKAPYLDDLLFSLSISLERASLVYIDWALGQGMPVLHPWLLEAKSWLNAHVNR